MHRSCKAATGLDRLYVGSNPILGSMKGDYYKDPKRCKKCNKVIEYNKRSNLRMICSNCDSQLPTYKSKNKGNGRHYRTKRYEEGKSY